MSNAWETNFRSNNKIKRIQIIMKQNKGVMISKEKNEKRENIKENPQTKENQKKM